MSVTVVWKSFLSTSYKQALNLLFQMLCNVLNMNTWTGLKDIHFELTHWGWVTHICVGGLAIIGSDNGLSPGRRQAFIWTNAGILLIGPLRTNFNEMIFQIRKFWLKKMHMKMSSAKWQPFCLGIIVLKEHMSEAHQTMKHWNMTVNTLRLRPNGHHFLDGIIQLTSLCENSCILIHIWLKFLNVPVKNNLALVQMMTWHQTSSKPEPWTMLSYTCFCTCFTQTQWGGNVMASYQGEW